MFTVLRGQHLRGVEPQLEVGRSEGSGERFHMRSGCAPEILSPDVPG